MLRFSFLATASFRSCMLGVLLAPPGIEGSEEIGGK